MADRQDSDREVLTSLPRSRPVRRSAKRGDRGDAKTAAASAQTRRATAAEPAPEAPAKPVVAPGESPRTRPARKVPPAGYAAPTGRADGAGAAGAGDVLSTTIQAAAELAQIGLTVGRQTLQSMLDRLPRP